MTTGVFNSSSGNSLVSLEVALMFRPFFMVSVIVVGSANLGCSCNQYENGENGKN